MKYRIWKYTYTFLSRELVGGVWEVQSVLGVQPRGIWETLWGLWKSLYLATSSPSVLSPNSQMTMSPGETHPLLHSLKLPVMSSPKASKVASFSGPPQQCTLGPTVSPEGILTQLVRVAPSPVDGSYWHRGCTPIIQTNLSSRSFSLGQSSTLKDLSGLLCLLPQPDLSDPRRKLRKMKLHAGWLLEAGGNA